MSVAENLKAASRALSEAGETLHGFCRQAQGVRRRWSEDDDALLRDYYPIVPTDILAIALRRKIGAVYQRAQNLGIRKSPEFLASPLSGRTGHDDRGRSGQFRKGHRTWNKDRKGWQAGGRSKETQFKPGTLNGRAAQLHQPIGTERVNRDGYRERKIRDDGPPQHRWRAVHLLVWEESHGPLPKGHAVVFRNGDKSDIHLENLELVSRAELMRRNTRHRYPEEINRAIAAKAALTRRINRLEKRA
jgi:hypothetical protein